MTNEVVPDSAPLDTNYSVDLRCWKGTMSTAKIGPLQAHLHSRDCRSGDNSSIEPGCLRPGA